MTVNKSFSGCHPFRADCVLTSIELDWFDTGWFTPEAMQRISGQRVESIKTDLENDTCPRCRRHLDPGNTAGSRVTTCRCIPICPACGADEVNQSILGRPASRVWEWPVGIGARTRRRNKAEVNATSAVLVGDHLVREDGVTTVTVDFTPSTGGWAQYGHDGEAS